MDPNTHLTSTQSLNTTEEFACMWNVPYYEAVGLLTVYTSLSTHPDITYVVQAMSHFSTKPGLEHWESNRFFGT